MSDFKEYELYCPQCDTEWTMHKRPETEVWCPFCEAEEPVKVREIK